MNRTTWRRWLGVAVAPVLLTGLVAQPASAAVSMVAKIVQEPGDFEARFPDVLQLPDKKLLAVWHRSIAHSGAPSTIQLAIGAPDGRKWDPPQRALPAGALPNTDTRDPKLSRLHDGSLMLTFFLGGAGGFYYAMWDHTKLRFGTPVKIELGQVKVGMLSHGPALALANKGSHVNQVLLPIYTTVDDGTRKAGAHYLRATYKPGEAKPLEFQGINQIIGNGNPADRYYQEPNLVQYGDTVVAVVRAEQGPPAPPKAGPSSAIVVRWNPYTATPDYTYQSFSGVLASSHHLLKTASGKLLFTYGDKARNGRPTVGMMIDNPTGTWVKGKVVPIYNSGWGDQANPSSVEIRPGVFLTLAYNAKPKTQDRPNITPDPKNGGSLWVMESHAADY